VELMGYLPIIRIDCRLCCAPDFVLTTEYTEREWEGLSADFADLRRFWGRRLHAETRRAQRYMFNSIAWRFGDL
jgi:hypothetical protein